MLREPAEVGDSGAALAGDPRTSANPASDRSIAGLEIAYVMSRFPKITETFILYEILELERRGARVRLYPLLRERTAVSHPEVERVLDRVHFEPFVSLAILRAHGWFLSRRPTRYLRALWRGLRMNFGSWNHFVGALGILGKVVRFAYLMERRGTQHVHAHFATHPALAGYLVEQLTGIPYSFTAHGSDLHVDQTGLAEKLRTAAFAVTVSEYNRAFIAERLGDWARDLVEVIHCGVDPEIFGTSGAARRGVDDPIRLICVASLRRVKGHEHLIRACELLAERGLDFRLELLGEGPREDALRAQVRAAGLEDRVEFLGARTRPEVLARLAAADIAVLTSIQEKGGRREGIPVTLMEAMAAGLPVVSSRLSGIPELVIDETTGLLAPPENAEAIASAIERLANAPDLRSALGAAGRERICAEFSLAASTAALASRFERSAGRTSETKA